MGAVLEGLAVVKLSAEHVLYPRTEYLRNGTEQCKTYTTTQDPGHIDNTARSAASVRGRLIALSSHNGI